MFPLTLTTVLSLISATAAQITHPNQLPALSPHWDEPGRVRPALQAGLPSTPVRWVEDWASIHILDFCKDEADWANLNLTQIDTFNIHYEDCAEPWIVCHHRAHPISKQVMIDFWGRVPLALRETVRHIALFPWPYSGGNRAYTYGDQIAFFGDADIYNLNVILHEVAHSVDSHIVRHVDTAVPFSSGARWRQTVSRDSAVVSDYSRSSWAENFAESLVHAVVDQNAAGGSYGLHPADVVKAANAFLGIRSFLPNAVRPRAKTQCTVRHQNGNAVLKNPAIRTSEPLPDTGFTTPLDVFEDLGDGLVYVHNVTDTGEVTGGGVARDRGRP